MRKSMLFALLPSGRCLVTAYDAGIEKIGQTAGEDGYQRRSCFHLMSFLCSIYMYTWRPHGHTVPSELFAAGVIQWRLALAVQFARLCTWSLFLVTCVLFLVGRLMYLLENQISKIWANLFNNSVVVCYLFAHWIKVYSCIYTEKAKMGGFFPNTLLNEMHTPKNHGLYIPIG